MHKISLLYRSGPPNNGCFTLRLRLQVLLYLVKSLKLTKHELYTVNHKKGGRTFAKVQKLKKSIKIFQSYDHKCSATFFMVHNFTVYIQAAVSSQQSWVSVLKVKKRLKPGTWYSAT